MLKKKSVLVFHTGHLGDMVCAIPAFRLVRNCFADAELTLLCDRPQGSKVAASDVISHLGIFEKIVAYASNRSFVTLLSLFRAVRKVQPDIAIVLPQGSESAEAVRRKKRFFEFCGVADVRGQPSPAARQNWQPNEPDRLVSILNCIDVRGAKPAYDIPIDAASHEAVKAKLSAVGVDATLPFLVFCGGGKAATQHWPMDRYAAVLPRVAAEIKWPIVGLGNPVEVEKYRTALLPCLPDLRLFAQSLAIPEIFELCRLAAAWFGNDTGPMHVAASVGCPVAAVISARNLPGCWDPDVERRIIFRHRTECEGCFLSECVKERHRCMTAITVEHVAAELIPFLKALSKG